MARWKITEPAFIADRLVNAGEEITTANTIIPGPHMEPLDDAARTLVDQHADRMQPTGNVLDQLTQALDDARAQAQAVAKAQAQTMADTLGSALAGSIAQAVAAALAAQSVPAAAAPSPAATSAAPASGGTASAKA